jgi:hypothetical protein
MSVVAIILAILYLIVALGCFVEWCRDPGEYGVGGLLSSQVIVFIIFAAIGSGAMLLYTMMTRGVL